MKIPRRRLRQRAAGAAVLPAVSQITAVEAFPVQPVRLAVPLPPGGAFDSIGHPWAEEERTRRRRREADDRRNERLAHGKQRIRHGRPVRMTTTVKGIPSVRAALPGCVS
jgi:hypothetical protein